MQTRVHGLGSRVPYQHHEIDAAGEQQRHISALRDFGEIREQECGIHDQERACERSGCEQVPAPDLAHGDEQQRGRHQHGSRNRDAIGRRQIIGFRKPDGKRDSGHHQQPVDDRDVDLSVAFGRGVHDLESRQPAELDRLLGHGERAGDDGLARYDGGDRSQCHHRNQQHRGTQLVEDIGVCRRAAEHQGGLTRVVQQQAGKHHAGPREPDGSRAEMPHIRVKRFGSGDAEEDATENQERPGLSREQVAQRVTGIECRQYRRILCDPPDAEHREAQEPNPHDRPERSSDA